jgi:hypothetical protein
LRSLKVYEHCINAYILLNVGVLQRGVRGGRIWSSIMMRKKQVIALPCAVELQLLPKVCDCPLRTALFDYTGLKRLPILWHTKAQK